jgi:hypothetical protein
MIKNKIILISESTEKILLFDEHCCVSKYAQEKREIRKEITRRRTLARIISAFRARYTTKSKIFLISVTKKCSYGKSIFTLRMDERNRLEASTIKSTVLLKHHFRNYKGKEFDESDELSIRNRKILEQIHSSYIANSDEVPLTHTAASSSVFL